MVGNVVNDVAERKLDKQAAAPESDFLKPFPRNTLESRRNAHVAVVTFRRSEARVRPVDTKADAGRTSAQQRAARVEFRQHQGSTYHESNLAAGNADKSKF